MRVSCGKTVNAQVKRQRDEIDSSRLKKLGVIEAVIAEPEVYTEETMQSVVFVLQKKDHRVSGHALQFLT